MSKHLFDLEPQHRLLILVLALALFGSGIAFANWHSYSPKQDVLNTNSESDDDTSSKVTSKAPAAPADITSGSGCHQSLWNHVYHPSRLKILDNCKTVSGVIAVIRHEQDGDYHILMHLDSQFDTLLNNVNRSAQHSDLILEPVCEGAVTQADATSACNGYKSLVSVPSVGTHVYVTGSYVLDTDHGWNEIHPVSNISSSPPARIQAQPPPSQVAAAPSPSSASPGVVKLSRTGICHVPSDEPYYDETTIYTPYPNLAACEAAGGHFPQINNAK